MKKVDRADGTAIRTVAAAMVCSAAIATGLGAQAPKLGYDDTPMQPNGKWHIHDGARPQPKVVTSGDCAHGTPVLGAF